MRNLCLQFVPEDSREFFWRKRQAALPRFYSPYCQSVISTCQESETTVTGNHKRVK
ncbi:hypothetical protein ACT691_00185 [Vibrio metschnikovii]